MWTRGLRTRLSLSCMLALMCPLPHRCGRRGAELAVVALSHSPLLAPNISQATTNRVNNLASVRHGSHGATSVKRPAMRVPVRAAIRSRRRRRTDAQRGEDRIPAVPCQRRSPPAAPARSSGRGAPPRPACRTSGECGSVRRKKLAISPRARSASSREASWPGRHGDAGRYRRPPARRRRPRSRRHPSAPVSAHRPRGGA